MTVERKREPICCRWWDSGFGSKHWITAKHICILPIEHLGLCKCGACGRCADPFATRAATHYRRQLERRDAN